MKYEDDVWFRVEEKDSKRFLQFAKDLGCIWINGTDIDPEKDKSGHYMGMENHCLGYVSNMIFHFCHDKHKVIDFNTIK